ncbi:MAG TPA: hypothetical protein VF281_03530 [Candidatus Saccharimonadales bacterium]
MKKLLLTVAAFALAVGFTTPSASALTCHISNTGPDSENTCTSIENFKCTVDNDNQVKVYNGNEQVSVSGGAITVTNTSGGSSTSGNAGNTNGTTVEGTIKNNSCVIAAAPVVTPPETPVEGGKGAVTPVPAPAVAAPAVLPNTSADSTIGIIAGLIIALGAAVVGSRLFVAYADMKS